MRQTVAASVLLLAAARGAARSSASPTRGPARWMSSDRCTGPLVQLLDGAPAQRLRVSRQPPRARTAASST